MSMHAERAAALYRAFEALNLTPFVREEFRSRTVLSFTAPAGVSAVELRRSLSGKFGMEITGGLGKLRERIVRVGLMGYVPLRDLVALVAATGLVLKERGVRVDLERALDEVYKLTARL